MSEKVRYKISFDEPLSHYCDVSVKLKCGPEGAVRFSMPAWTPGSYMVRDYSGKVHGVSAKGSQGNELVVEKTTKNTWTVYGFQSTEIELSYRVYCNELTVRTSEINAGHAFLNTSGIFMFAEGLEHLPCILEIKLPRIWKRISTGLDPAGKNTFKAENYDTLIDCPVLIGNQEVLEFKVNNIPHRICISGEGNYDPKKLISDFTKIVQTQVNFFRGEIPYRHYTFLVLLVDKGGGGLEHLNSFAVVFPRLNFTDNTAYRKFLGLVSHEFFHLWNVKRIRPLALGPFDYHKENYTKSLWIAEGWTSYYDNVFLVRAGLITPAEYLEMFEHELNDVMRYQGRFRQGLRESSFDTWVKFYKKDENTNNTQVSYYTKGALAAALLNVEIMRSTNCRHSLDDVLLKLYDDFLRDPSTGYTEDRVKEIAEFYCGKKLDLFWKNVIDGTSELPVFKMLSDCGVKTIDENENSPCSLDLETKSENGRLIVAKVFEGGSSYGSGLSANDELIAVDGYRIDAELLNKFLRGKKRGDKINVLIARKGIISLIQVELKKPLPKYKLQPDSKPGKRQKAFFVKWLYG